MADGNRGHKTSEPGICPAAAEISANGVNGATAGALPGTLCGKKVQDTFASKLANCLQCEFYRNVRDEGGAAFVQSRDILVRIRKS
ncbi:MAG: two-CW domain-containing protein [Desulfobulbaceae bacterium]